MAENLQKQKAQSISSFRIMDLAILIFALIFIVDVVFYMVFGGSLRDFVVVMFMLYITIVTLTTRLRFQLEIGRQIITEWIVVSIIGIVISLYLAFVLSL